MNNSIATISNNPAALTLTDIRLDRERFPRIYKLTREDAVCELTKIVTQAFLYRGQNADENNIKFIAVALLDELLEDSDHCGTKFITMAEIARIVKRAVLSSEMFGVSVASLYKIILEYVKGEGHRIEAEAQKKKREADERALNSASFSPMLQAYAGEIIRRNK